MPSNNKLQQQVNQGICCKDEQNSDSRQPKLSIQNKGTNSAQLSRHLSNESNTTMRKRHLDSQISLVDNISCRNTALEFKQLQGSTYMELKESQQNKIIIKNGYPFKIREIKHQNNENKQAVSANMQGAGGKVGYGNKQNENVVNQQIPQKNQANQKFQEKIIVRAQIEEMKGNQSQYKNIKSFNTANFSQSLNFTTAIENQGNEQENNASMTIVGDVCDEFPNQQHGLNHQRLDKPRTIQLSASIQKKFDYAPQQQKTRRMQQIQKIKDNLDATTAIEKQQQQEKSCNQILEGKATKKAFPLILINAEYPILLDQNKNGLVNKRKNFTMDQENQAFQSDEINQQKSLSRNYPKHSVEIQKSSVQFRAFTSKFENSTKEYKIGDQIQKKSIHQLKTGAEIQNINISVKQIVEINSPQKQEICINMARSKNLSQTPQKEVNQAEIIDILSSKSLQSAENFQEENEEHSFIAITDTAQKNILIQNKQVNPLTGAEPNWSIHKDTHNFQYLDANHQKIALFEETWLLNKSIPKIHSTMMKQTIQQSRDYSNQIVPEVKLTNSVQFIQVGEANSQLQFNVQQNIQLENKDIKDKQIIIAQKGKLQTEYDLSDIDTNIENILSQYTTKQQQKFEQLNQNVNPEKKNMQKNLKINQTKVMQITGQNTQQKEPEKFLNNGSKNKNSSKDFQSEDSLVSMQKSVPQIIKINSEITKQNKKTDNKKICGLASTKSDENIHKLSLRLSNLKEIQPEFLAKKSKLTQIDLRNNRVQKLPEEICDIETLLELKLDYNFLTSLPTQIHKLQRLRYLSVSQNNLKSIESNLMLLGANLKHLILNDNKIHYIQSKIGNLFQLETLLLHNNVIVELPSTFYRMSKLSQLSLDWFSYIYNEQLQIQTKIFKGVNTGTKTDRLATQSVEDIASSQRETKKHQIFIDQFLGMLKLAHLLEVKIRWQKRKNVIQENPQQDDSEILETAFPQQQYNNKSIAQNIFKGVTSKNRNQKYSKLKNELNEYDLLSDSKPVKIAFIQFLMYFYNLTHIDQLVMKIIFQQKQRKLSHVTALHGHLYLYKDIIKQIDLYSQKWSDKNQELVRSIGTFQNTKILQIQYQFINAVDRDFSTPLILALKNKKNALVQELLDHPKICLLQSSAKFGTALHVALNNDDLKIATQIFQKLVICKQFNPEQDLNKVDEEGNTPLHLLMKVFGSELALATKLAFNLSKYGANLNFKNKIQHTPIHQALYYSQIEAIKFALEHNEQIKNMKQSNQFLQTFDFKSQGGKLQFSPLHFAVHQNHFLLLFALLRSNEVLDHECHDIFGRKPIDLCTSISAIFKALRRELKKQRKKNLNNNLEQTQKQEVSFKPFHQKLLKGMNLAQFYINRKQIYKNQIQNYNQNQEIHLNTFTQRHMSVQNSIMGINSNAGNQYQQQHTQSSRDKLISKASPASAEGQSKILPGAFKKKVSMQHQITQLGTLRGDIGQNKGKNYGVKKTSIQIGESTAFMSTFNAIHKVNQINKLEKSLNEQKKKEPGANQTGNFQKPVASHIKISMNTSRFIGKTSTQASKTRLQQSNFSKRKNSVDDIKTYSSYVLLQHSKNPSQNAVESVDQRQNQIISLKSISELMAQNAEIVSQESRKKIIVPQYQITNNKVLNIEQMKMRENNFQKQWDQQFMLQKKRQDYNIEQFVQDFKNSSIRTYDPSLNKSQLNQKCIPVDNGSPMETSLVNASLDKSNESSQNKANLNYKEDLKSDKKQENLSVSPEQDQIAQSKHQHTHFKNSSRQFRNSFLENNLDQPTFDRKKQNSNSKKYDEKQLSQKYENDGDTESFLETFLDSSNIEKDYQKLKLLETIKQSLQGHTVFPSSPQKSFIKKTIDQNTNIWKQILNNYDNSFKINKQINQLSDFEQNFYQIQNEQTKQKINHIQSQNHIRNQEIQEYNFEDHEERIEPIQMSINFENNLTHRRQQASRQMNMNDLETEPNHRLVDKKSSCCVEQSVIKQINLATEGNQSAQKIQMPEFKSNETQTNQAGRDMLISVEKADGSLSQSFENETITLEDQKLFLKQHRQNNILVNSQVNTNQTLCRNGDFDRQSRSVSINTRRGIAIYQNILQNPANAQIKAIQNNQSIQELENDTQENQNVIIISKLICVLQGIKVENYLSSQIRNEIRNLTDQITVEKYFQNDEVKINTYLGLLNCLQATIKTKFLNHNFFQMIQNEIINIQHDLEQKLIIKQNTKSASINLLQLQYQQLLHKNNEPILENSKDELVWKNGQNKKIRPRLQQTNKPAQTKSINGSVNGSAQKNFDTSEKDFTHMIVSLQKVEQCEQNKKKRLTADSRNKNSIWKQDSSSTPSTTKRQGETTKQTLKNKKNDKEAQAILQRASKVSEFDEKLRKSQQKNRKSKIDIQSTNLQDALDQKIKIQIVKANQKLSDIDL